MVSATVSHNVVSHTRAASLANLAGLCLVLRDQAAPLSVGALARKAVDRAILEDDVVIARGSRLPTRVNHHMIALRELQLVAATPGQGHVWYDLTPAGYAVADAARQEYSGDGPLALTDALRETWRPVLVESDYVRRQWLKYFMPRTAFTYSELLSEGVPITIHRIPMSQRDHDDDSGYRLVSERWGERTLTEIERREIYEGLRRWTNDTYLTDDRLPPGVRGPFSPRDSYPDDLSESASHVVTSWLSPANDLDLFEERIRAILLRREGGNRITIPELIIALCDDYGYAKQNLRAMLVALYYERGGDYVFERASRFLMRSAFKDVKSDDYYVQIEGVWRTGLVCY